MKRNSKTIAEKQQRRVAVQKHIENPDYNPTKYNGGAYATHHEAMTQMKPRLRKAFIKPLRSKERRVGLNEDAPRFTPNRTLQHLAANG